MKGIRSFLGHAEFYRQFCKDFSKIAQLLCNLLEKDTPFDFDDLCLQAFNILKEKLIKAQIMAVPDWGFSFKIMCNSSDFAIGAMLGLRKDKVF